MNWPAYISYIIISTFTPGPNNLAALAVAGRSGFWRSLKFRCGLSSGFVLIAIAAALGGNFLIDFVPTVRPLLTAVGVVYILRMAWKILHAHSGSGEQHSNSYISGVLVCLVNVKCILFIITTLAVWILPVSGTRLQVFGYSFVLPLFAFAGQNLWAAAGSAFNRLWSSHEHIVDTFLAALLVWCAVSLCL